MKKITLIFSLLLLSFGFASAQNNSAKQEDPYASYKNTGAKMPTLKILSTKGKTFTNTSMKSSKNTFLIFFSPTCGHCINLGKELTEDADLFKNTKVAFMCQPDRAGDLNSYIEKTGMSKRPELMIGADQSQATVKLAFYAMFPIVYVYDHNQKLVKIFEGDTPQLLEKMKAYLN